MIAFGGWSIEAVFRDATRIEPWIRRITGAVFIVAGVYHTAVSIFEVR